MSAKNMTCLNTLQRALEQTEQKITLANETDDNGNAMLQSFLSKLFEKRNRLKILSYRRYGANGNFSLFFFRILFTLLYAVELALSR